VFGRLIPGIAGLLLVATTVLGGEVAGDVTPLDESDPLTRILEAEDSELRTIGLLRARLTYPQLVSGAVGVMWVRMPKEFECVTVCRHRGKFIQVEPGIAGIQLAAGYAVVLGEKKSNKWYLRRVYVGWGIKAALLHTWGGSPLDPPDQDFVGLEGSFTIAGFNVSVGLMHGIDRSPEDARWLVTGGLGWGF